MTDLAVENLKMHRRTILNPVRWPMLVLPLKRANAFDPGNLAVLTVPLNVYTIPEDAPIEIRIGSMYDDLSKLPTKTYQNVDALLADGWRVD